MISNLSKIVNNKLIIYLPKNNIFFIPSTNNKVGNEAIFRLVLNTPEPSDKLSTTEKIDFHKKNNSEFINKYKDKFKNLIYSDISKIDNEVWLIFDSESDEIINMLSELEEVQLIYLYNQSGNGYSLKSSGFGDIINDNQEELIKEIKNKLFIKDAELKKEFTSREIKSMNVRSASYNEDTKTLTVNLTTYNSENAIAQLFAYIYGKNKNYSEIVDQLSSEITNKIKTSFNDKKISRINFIEGAIGWPKESSNRFINLLPPSLKNINNSHDLQQKYLNSEIYFDNNKILEELKESFNLALDLYKELLIAVKSQGPDVLYLISKLDPNQINLEEIKRIKSSDEILYVRLSVFDTQEKMNILYSYLADEPYNKDQWINRISQLILNGISSNNLGKLKDYFFITYDENTNFPNISIRQASIGGIDLKTSYYDLDNGYDEIKEPFPYLDSKFNNEEDFNTNINFNIQWNRNTYLSYYYKEPLIYKFNKNFRRSIDYSEINHNFWDMFTEVLSKITVTNTLDGNDLIINIKGFRNLNDFKILLFLIGNDKEDEINNNWREKFVDIIKNALSASDNLKQLKNLYVTINDHSKNKFLLLDLTSLPNKLDKNELNTSYDEQIKTTFLKNLSRINSELIVTAIHAGIIPDGLMNSAYALQFATVGLSTFFNKVKANLVNFNSKNNKIGILEAEDGVVLATEFEHFSRDRLIIEPKYGKFAQHSDLVAKIAGSQKDGVDRTSTIISAGFKYFSTNSETIWNALKAVDWIVENGATILNCSWAIRKTKESDPDFATYSDLAYKLDYITRKYGIVVFKSSGNNHEEFKPYFRDAGLAFNIICVGSTTSSGSKLSIFSDYEKLEFYKMTKEAPKPLLVAPGEGYLYLDRYYDGTSFAAPLVSGTVSILMKEYEEKLKGKPAAIMATLAASSDNKYPGHVNDNGLKYETGAGLLNYDDARFAAYNSFSTEISPDLTVGHRIYESGEIKVDKNETLVVATAGLYNGGYVSSIDLPDLKPTKGGISSVPIIGYLYLSYAYIYNNYQTRKFDSKFEDNKAKILKLNQSIDVNNLDTYLMPPNITATLEMQDPNTKKWKEVQWINEDKSHYSNIKRFEYFNKDSTNVFRYIITVCKEGKHVDGDHTKNLIAFTHVIKSN